MPYDLFISYARFDNLDGRITDLKVQIETDFRAFKPGRDLVCFFDTEDIKGMEDWRHRILQGLRESTLLLLVLSPGYLSSPYCEWEIIEYLKYEHSRASAGQGVAPVYFVEVPGLDSPGFEMKAAAWVARVRRRNHFDLRPWHDEGAAALQRLEVRARLIDLERALHTRISKLASIAEAPGNLPMHNPYFVGRESEMRRIDESTRLGSFGVITVLQGLGGLGKTSLAVQYAYAYAEYYPGGRWFLKCSGETNLNATLCLLGVDLGITFNEEEKHDDDQAARHIVNELEIRARKGAEARLSGEHPPSPGTLLLLDNVDFPGLIQPPQTDLITGKPWLHILITTRIGEDDLGCDPKRHKLLILDELPVEDAVRLIERHQPDELFPNPQEQKAAEEIARLLDGFTLAIEVVAVYLSERRGRITCTALLERLRQEGLTGYEDISRDTKRGISYTQKYIDATLGPTLDLLSPAEFQVLAYAALLPPDNISLPWLRNLSSIDYPTLRDDPGPGYDDLWINLVNHLIGLRLLQGTNVKNNEGFPLVIKMHRIVSQLVNNRVGNDIYFATGLKFQMSGLIFNRTNEFIVTPVNLSLLWELDCLYKAIQLSLLSGLHLAQKAALTCCIVLCNYGRYRFALELAEAIIEIIENGRSEYHISIVWCHNMAGVTALSIGDTEIAEYHFLKAKELQDSQEIDDLDRLDTLSNIGCLYRETFRPELALGPCKEALAIVENKFHQKAPEVGLRCINLGLVFQDLCKLGEAIPLFERAVEIDLCHTDLSLIACQDISTLAEALRNAGRISEAEVKAKEAIQLAIVYGYDRHPVMSTIKNNYAKTLEASKLYNEARSLMESALEITELNYDLNSTHRAFCLNNLGINSLCSGDLNLSLVELSDSLEIEKNQRKPSYHKLAHRELNLGVAYLMNNDIEQSILHLTSGWNYNSETQQPDLITARLLLARLAASFFAKENHSLFIGQIITLLEYDMLIASNIDIKWSLEELLGNFVNKYPPNESLLWRLLYNAVNDKLLGHSKVDMNVVSAYSKISLKKKWQ
ncbi:MAG: toll/interleukin-1 receptor domain-containing protein [Bacteroidota bacterium]